MRLPLSLWMIVCAAACGGGDAPSSDDGTATGEIRLSGIGLMSPESVLWDSVADVYLVSSVNGSPGDKDDNGFITRITPQGQVDALKWIDGSTAGVNLSAPKGMAIKGDTLYVTDIDCVRRFVRTSGTPAGEICFPGATFLNDLAVDNLGTLYVTDSGFRVDSLGAQVNTGTDAVWRFTPAGQTGKVIEGGVLGHPSGIAFRGQDAFIVTAGSGEIYQIGPENNRNIVLPGAPERALDDIVFTKDGGYLFTSWGDKAVHRVGPDGTTSRALENVEGPAGIGYDAKRDRVLVPLMPSNEVRIAPLFGAARPGSE